MWHCGQYFLSVPLSAQQLSCISHCMQISPEKFSIVVVEEPLQFDLSILKSLIGLVVSCYNWSCNIMPTFLSCLQTLRCHICQRMYLCMCVCVCVCVDARH